MALSWIEITDRALRFSKKWKGATDESAEAQSFLNDFFNVFGVDRKRVATFETKVPMGSRNGYIDLVWKGVILIEMKSKGKSLDKAYRQARDYTFNLKDEELPEYIMVSDFENIRLYRDATGQEWNFKTSQLYKKVKLFSDLAGYKISVNMPKDKEVDIKAAEKMAKLHDILKSHGYEGHSLEVYLVRLLFCLFADDTRIFEKNIFFDYISNSKEDGSDLSHRISKLFEVLNISLEERKKHIMLSDELRRFEYINGSLFEEVLPLADFDYRMRKIIFDCCAFDWSYISPAIFGAMFQGVMNPIERRELGAHYTSEENILKVIKPLFLDELREEFECIKGNSQQLNLFHGKLSKLKFLDPACGCGNFLIITYKELRLLELEVLKMLIDTGGQRIIDISVYCKINVNQFYGIEYEEFPCQIAKVGMWLIDHQMNTLVGEHFGLYYARLPLNVSATIVNENALKIDWKDIVPKSELSYIMGNPPFIGKKEQSLEQKRDMQLVLGDFRNYNILDYVTAWYRKASEYMVGTRISTAFVSTNSIIQGEQVAIIWKPLIEKYKICIEFAYRTFKWNNEAKGKAGVHCVIIGFSVSDTKNEKRIYKEDTSIVKVQNINPYLVDADNIFVNSRSMPLCVVLKISYGSMPIDNGHLILSDEEKENFIKEEPITNKFIKRYVGGDEIINNSVRWCLWLKGVSPSDINKSKLTLERLRLNQNYRRNSKREATQNMAETPQLFGEIRQPETSYLAIPKVSSENRKYIPMVLLTPDIIINGSTLVIPNATLYHFGVLTSKVHMSWMRAVGGRLESRYQYSASVVYNTFPWCNPNERQKVAIENAANEVLNARALFPETPLAILYDPLSMPQELVKAHNKLDRVVVAAYGGKGFNTEAERVADLMERYQKLVDNSK